jgi:hypothetical protein
MSAIPSSAAVANSSASSIYQLFSHSQKRNLQRPARCRFRTWCGRPFPRWPLIPGGRHSSPGPRKNFSPSAKSGAQSGATHRAPSLPMHTNPPIPSIPSAITRRWIAFWAFSIRL